MTEKAQPRRTTGFGTFGGVFTPCTLTILGVIMFLRLGSVVGQSGIINALIIIVCANVITGLTGLSLSAIATNTQVKGGGAYFLISRSLGVEFGGAIGLVFFLAQAISVAMYVIGFAEAFVGSLPVGGLSPVLVATCTNVVVFICVFIGAGWTIRVQYGILAILGLSLVSLYTGAIGSFSTEHLKANLRPDFDQGESFFTMFALFFPAVTGIMAGANMSGDLRRPERSIPLGTLAAVVVTGIIYLSEALLIGCAVPGDTLRNDNLVIASVSAWPVLIIAGVFAATLSSALGSMMGAPRILQALARDGVFPSLNLFGSGSGAANEPRRAIVLTFVIAQVCILLADLNTIAPLITMFFMITYGLLNLATFYEAITKNPSYRPTFRFCHWATSLAAAIGCLAVMVLIEWRWALAAVGVMAGLYWYIARKEIRARWGDVGSGVLFERVRRTLLKLEGELEHPKNWRPIIVALSGAGWSRAYLAVYGHWLTTGRGILTLGQVVHGEADELLERRNAQEKLLQAFVDDQQLEAFPAVVAASTLREGIRALVQCVGMGRLRPNTLLLGWPTDTERAEGFGTTLRAVRSLGRNIVALRFSEEVLGEDRDPWEVPAGTIDVWWRGHANGEMMLVLAHLLRANQAWRTSTIRLLRVVPSEEARRDVQAHLEELIRIARIPAQAVVVVAQGVIAAIQSSSAPAGVVFIGFEVPEKGDEVAFFERMEQFGGGLPRIIFVSSIGGASLEH